MDMFINYDKESIVELTPEEYLESFNLEKLCFENKSIEEANQQTEQNKENKETKYDNMFFDLEYYNLQKETPRNTFKSSEKKVNLINDELIFGVKKKNVSAWPNLNLNNSAKSLVYSDRGHIEEKFKSTHMPYSEIRKAKMQKLKKKREIQQMEIDNENFIPSTEGVEVFYDEKTQRQLAGIHVDREEKYEIDW